MSKFGLKTEDGFWYIGIPAANGPLAFDTEVEAQERADEVNALNDDEILSYRLHVVPLLHVVHLNEE